MKKTYKHSYKASEKQLVSLSVYNTGLQKCTPRYQWGPGIRDHYLIHHIIAGKGFYQLHDKTYALSAGDTFLVYPNTEVLYYADPEDPWEYTWVGFAGNDVIPLLENTDFTKESPVIHQGTISKQIKKHFLNIYAASGNDFYNTVDMTGKLYSALSIFMKHAVRTESPDNIQEAYIKKATEYVTGNYSYPITVNDIASYTGISRSHLFRIFQEQLQQSPKEYLTAVRIGQAKLLLKKTQLSVTAIARSVGYEDSLYFSRAFKNQEGISPSGYRGA